MRHALVFFHYVLVVSCLFMSPAHAQQDTGADRRAAQLWLKKIQAAAKNLNYAGVFVYQQANQVRTSRITHIADGRNEIEKIEILDGRPREYIRKNEEITYYLPDAKVLQIERQVTQDIFPSILAANPSELSEHYRITREDTGRVAGFDSQAILLEPRDNLRYGYRLWAEKNSGLLLRAQTLDQDGVAVEQISFTQLEINNIDRNRVRPTYPNTSRWTVEKPVMNTVSLSGWNVKAVPAGFRRIRELTRIVSDSSAPNSATVSTHSNQREVAQIVYSDGLAAISIFIEPGTQSRTEGSMRQGAMNIVGKRQGEFWLTIVGEVPAAAIRQIANSIEFKPK